MKDTQEDRKYKKSQITKERIVRASLTIMTRKGYENTTIRDICKEAKVSVGTFYKYFRTKNDTYVAVYEPADEYFTNTVAKSIRGYSAVDKVVDFFRYYAKMNLNTGIEMVKILYSPDNSWFVKRRPMQQVLEKIIKNGQESGELADDMEATEIVDFLFIFMRGCCYNWCMLNGNYDLEAQMVEYVKRVMPAIQKPYKVNDKKRST
jgi:TetR/AcrR family fatty acid metabolism transcriptional regulator